MVFPYEPTVTTATAPRADRSPDRLARLPKGTIVPPGTTAQTQADLCQDASTKALTALADVPAMLRRWQFLDRALAEHNEPSPEREQALFRRTWYRSQVRGDLTEIILHESRGDLAWRYLSVAERIDLDVASLWECDPERVSLIGLTFFSGHSWATRYLPVDFDLKVTIGFVPNLKRLQPYRHDIAEYINRGWLEGDLGGQWAKAEQAAKRKSAIAGITREKVYGKRET